MEEKVSFEEYVKWCKENKLDEMKAENLVKFKEETSKRKDLEVLKKRYETLCNICGVEKVAEVGANEYDLVNSLWILVCGLVHDTNKVIEVFE